MVEWFVVLAVCILLSTFAYDELQARMGSRDGRNDAAADIASESLKLKYAGKPPYIRQQVIDIYREQYGISLEYVGGCCPSQYRMAYNSAYNNRMNAAIESRHPNFDHARVANEVRAIAEAKYDAQWNAPQ